MAVQADPAEEAALAAAFLPVEIALRGLMPGPRPGGHRSRAEGSGGLFAGLGDLMSGPDPRRIDLRSSLTDPFGGLHLRRFRQPVAARAVVLLDCSASMAARGRVDRRAVAALLVRGLGLAVTRGGDRFGLVPGAGDAPAVWPPAGPRGLGGALASALARTPFRGGGLGGLGAAAAQIGPGSGGRRMLVFVLSDFLAPPDEIDAVLGRLAGHDLRPVVLEDGAFLAPAAETASRPVRRGLVALADPETGTRRLVLMRPGLARDWAARAAETARQRDAVFAAHGAAALVVRDQVDPARLAAGLVRGAVA